MPVGEDSEDLHLTHQHVERAAATLADGGFDSTIAGFGVGDALDLRDIGTAAYAALGAGNVLTVSGGGAPTLTLQLDPGASYASEVFRLASDGAGGTTVTIDQAPVFTSPDSFAVEENRTTVGTATAADPDHDAFSFALAAARTPRSSRLTHTRARCRS